MISVNQFYLCFNDLNENGKINITLFMLITINYHLFHITVR